MIEMVPVYPIFFYLLLRNPCTLFSYDFPIPSVVSNRNSFLVAKFYCATKENVLAMQGGPCELL